jgi:hypothetical protein
MSGTDPFAAVLELDRVMAGFDRTWFGPHPDQATDDLFRQKSRSATTM